MWSLIAINSLYTVLKEVSFTKKLPTTPPPPQKNSTKIKPLKAPKSTVGKPPKKGSYIVRFPCLKLLTFSLSKRRIRQNLRKIYLNWGYHCVKKTKYVYILENSVTRVKIGRHFTGCVCQIPCLFFNKTDRLYLQPVRI